MNIWEWIDTPLQHPLLTPPLTPQHRSEQTLGSALLSGLQAGGLNYTPGQPCQQIFRNRIMKVSGVWLEWATGTWLILWIHLWLVVVAAATEVPSAAKDSTVYHQSLSCQ